MTHFLRQFRYLFAVLPVVSALGMPAAAQAHADEKKFVRCGDTAGLIDAIEDANANNGGTIKLAEDCTYRIRSAYNQRPPGQNGPNGLPIITSRIEIEGEGSTITRSSTSPFRIFEVAENGNLTLEETTISNGYAQGSSSGAGDGGAIFVEGGVLTLKESCVTRNAADSDGGAIQNEKGKVTLREDSTVSHNKSADDGGGINNPKDSVLRLDEASITDNEAKSTSSADGGGINNGGALYVDKSYFADNRALGSPATGDGGAINNNGGSAEIEHTIFHDNFASTDGGAINNGEETPLEVEESTFADNRAGSRGGAVNNEGTAKVEETSVSLNKAGFGGGFYNENAVCDGHPCPAHLTLEKSKVVNNTATAPAGGGGIKNENGAVVTLRNTKVANNKPNNCTGVPGC